MLFTYAWVSCIRARFQPCPEVWTFAGAARLGVRRLDAAFLAEHGWLADAAPLAKAVATLPHCAPESAFSRRGESPLQVNVTCNRLQLRRRKTGWGAAGGERPVRKESPR